MWQGPSEKTDDEDSRNLDGSARGEGGEGRCSYGARGPTGFKRDVLQEGKSALDAEAAAARRRRFVTGPVSPAPPFSWSRPGMSTHRA